MSNTDHIVFLIGDKPDGALNKAMEECPHLDVRARHSDLACMHCGVHFPMHLLLPLDWDMLVGISKVFRKKHRGCKKEHTGNNMAGHSWACTRGKR